MVPILDSSTRNSGDIDKDCDVLAIPSYVPNYFGFLNSHAKFFFFRMANNDNEGSSSAELFSPKREDSDTSWRASQNQEEDEETEEPKEISRDKLFLISLAAITSLFT
jgi:hypothetical protein